MNEHTPATPGQIAFEAYAKALDVPSAEWGADDFDHEAWQAAAQAVLAAGATRLADASRDSLRAGLVATVGDCCKGSDPLCAGGCLVESAVKQNALAALGSGRSESEGEALTDLIAKYKGSGEPAFDAGYDAGWNAAVAHTAPQAEPGTRYVHRKSGGTYTLLHTGSMESGEGDEQAIYRSEQDGTSIWIRPMSEFAAKFTLVDHLSRDVRELFTAHPAPAPHPLQALADAQVPLPPEMAKVIEDNRWSLYARDTPATIESMRAENRAEMALDSGRAELDERAAFEKWWNPSPNLAHLLEWSDGKYTAMPTECAWWAWQARAHLSGEPMPEPVNSGEAN